MTSVEANYSKEFNELRQRLSSDLGKELSETEFMKLVHQFSTNNYVRLLNASKVKLNDIPPTQEQIDRMKEYIITDVEETDISERIDEILYG